MVVVVVGHDASLPVQSAAGIYVQARIQGTIGKDGGKSPIIGH